MMLADEILASMANLIRILFLNGKIVWFSICIAKLSLTIRLIGLTIFFLKKTATGNKLDLRISIKLVALFLSMNHM